jgi:penicillin-binding protein 2
MKLSVGRTQDDFRRAFRTSSILMISVFVVLTIRVWHLQILNGEKWLSFSQANQIKLKILPALRGTILDRNGEIIAETQPAYDLLMTPNRTKPTIEQALSDVAKLLNWSDNEILTLYEANRSGNLNRPFVLKKNISREEVAILKTHQTRFPGFDVEVVPVRTYQDPEVASHLLGRLGEISAGKLKKFQEEGELRYRQGNYIGVSGIESKYETYLRGDDGVLPVVEDVWGRQKAIQSDDTLLPDFSEKKPVPGHTLTLTIDWPLQKLATELLKGKKGSLVAMDPRSGEILAIESQPSFSSQAFVRGSADEYWKTLTSDPEKPLYNRAAQAVYPPASTFKAFTALAALSEGIMSPDEKIYCPGYYRIGREVKRCWKRVGHGEMNVVDAIKHSCDVYFYEAGKRLGIEVIAMYAKKMGLGSRTGIDYIRDSAGLVPTPDWKQRVYGQPWVKGETLSVAIGQGALLTTSLQMARSYATLINGGFVLEPSVLLKVENAEKEIVENFERKEQSTVALDEQAVALVREGLERVVQEKGGTAYWYAKSKVVPIAGKTGTAQVVSLKSGLDIKDHAWFVGYAPADDPEVVVSVIVEHGEHGSSGAAPLVKAIIEQYMEPNEL